MSQHRFFEGLETRQLLSAAPTLFSATVKVDRAVIRADLNAFKGDIARCDAHLSRDLHKIHKHTAAGDTSLDASILQLHTDVKTMRSQLQQDRLAEQANALQDESVIKLDLLQIRKDKGNATALAADQTKLHADRAQLQTDLLAGLDARVATRQSFASTISNDTLAIVTAANNDAAASAALKADATTFAADRATCLSTLTSDLQTLATARAKLAADLSA